MVKLGRVKGGRALPDVARLKPAEVRLPKVTVAGTSVELTSLPLGADTGLEMGPGLGLGTSLFAENNFLPENSLADLELIGSSTLPDFRTLDISGGDKSFVSGALEYFFPQTVAASRNFVAGMRSALDGILAGRGISSVQGVANGEFGKLLADGIHTISDAKRFLELGSEVSPMLAELYAIMSDRPELWDRVIVNPDGGGSCCLREGDAIIDRELPGTEVVLGKGTSGFVLGHELFHFLPLSVVKSYIPEGLELPEIDPTDDLLTLAKNIMLGRFYEEAITACFELQLAHDLLMVGYSPEVMPDYVWAEKEIFDTGIKEFLASYVYLGDNHKALYPLYTAHKIASTIKRDPSKLKDLKVGDVDVGTISAAEITKFIAEHPDEIRMMKEFLAEFFSRDYRKHLGEVEKFQTHVAELRHAVIISGALLKKLEVGIARGHDKEDMVASLLAMGDILRMFKGKRLTRILGILTEYALEYKSFDLVIQIGEILFDNGYATAARSWFNRFDVLRIIRGAGDDDSFPYELYRKVTGRDHPAESLYGKIFVTEEGGVATREEVFTSLAEIAEHIRTYNHWRTPYDAVLDGLERRDFIVAGLYVVYKALLEYGVSDLSPAEQDSLQTIFNFLLDPEAVYVDRATGELEEKQPRPFTEMRAAFADLLKGDLDSVDVQISYLDAYHEDFIQSYSMFLPVYLRMRRGDPDYRPSPFMFGELIQRGSHELFEHWDNPLQYYAFPDSSVEDVEFESHFHEMQEGFASMLVFYELERYAEAAEHFVESIQSYEVLDQSIYSDNDLARMAQILKDQGVEDPTVDAWAAKVREAPPRPELLRTDDMPASPKRRQAGDLPDLNSATAAEITEFIEAWQTSIDNSQPLQAKPWELKDWLVKLSESKINERAELVADALRVYMFEVTSGFAREVDYSGGELWGDARTLRRVHKEEAFTRWLRVFEDVTLDVQIREEILSEAVDSFLPEKPHPPIPETWHRIVTSINSLGPVALKEEYPKARLLFLERVSGYLTSGDMELSTINHRLVVEIANNLLYPLLKLHPEIISPFFYGDVRALGEVEDWHFVTAVNTIFADLIAEIDVTRDLLEWETEMIAYGTMDPDAVEFELVREISAHVADPDYSLERQAKLKEVLHRFVQYRLEEYMAGLGDLKDFEQGFFSENDLREMPVFALLFYALDAAELREAYDLAELSLPAGSFEPANLWDYIEAEEGLTPVQRVVIEVLLESRSQAIARAKVSMIIEIADAEHLDLELLQMGVESMMVAGFGSPCLHKYYQEVKADRVKLQQLIGWLVKFEGLNHTTEIGDYEFMTLLRFAQQGHEELFWKTYERALEYMPVGGRSLVSQVSADIAKLKELVASFREGGELGASPLPRKRNRFVIKRLSDYYYLPFIIPYKTKDRVRDRASFLQAEKQEIPQLKFLMYIKYMLEVAAGMRGKKISERMQIMIADTRDRFADPSVSLEYLHSISPEAARKHLAAVDRAIIHFLEVRRAGREEAASLPAAARKLPDIVRLLFTEMWLQMDGREKGRIAKKIEAAGAKDDQIKALQIILQEKKLEKIGQVILMLVGIVPDSWRTPFASTLEDNQPASFYEVKEIIEDAYGGPLTDRYREFDEEPIAVGSIAQVHRAVTVDGREVAVKVIIPARRVVMQKSLKQLQVAIAESMHSQMLFDLPLDLGEFFKWFNGSLQPEFNLIRETENNMLFRQLAGDEVGVPEIHKVGPNVMEMDFVEFPAERYTADSIEVVIKAVMRAMLAGFVHDDPHAGNIAGTTLFDFGRAELLKPEARSGLMDFFLGAYFVLGGEGDVAEVVTKFRALGLNGKEIELAKLAEYLESSVFRKGDFDGEKLTEIIRLAGEDGFVLQPKIYAVLKVLITLDALGRQHIGDDFSMGSILLELSAELPEKFAPVPDTPDVSDDLRWFPDKPKSLNE